MKRMIFGTAAVLALIGIFGLSGCEKRSPVALGQEWEIYVVADQQDWDVIGQTITDILEKKLVTPQTETEFEVIHVDPKDFGRYLKMRNLLIISSLQPGTETDRIVRKALKDEYYDKVVKQEEYFFVSRNQWAKEQFIVVLAAPGKEALQASIDSYPDYIYHIFNQNRNHQLRFAMFKRTQGRIERHLKKQHGWTLKIPFYYELVDEDTSKKVVHLKSPEPERHLLVHWIDHPKSKKVNETWLKEKANWLGRYFYNAKIVDGYYFTAADRFQNRPALKIIGLWESENDAKGGPIEVLTFYDQNQDRIYVLMFGVFAPHHRKEPFLRELRLMANTFQSSAPKKSGALLSKK